MLGPCLGGARHGMRAPQLSSDTAQVHKAPPAASDDQTFYEDPQTDPDRFLPRYCEAFLRTINSTEFQLECRVAPLFNYAHNHASGGLFVVRAAYRLA